jgi:alpha-L-fucosidase 2
MRSLLLLVIFLACFADTKAQKIDWDKFMDDQSLFWDSLSTNFYTGIPLGNGRLGVLIYKENEKALRFDVGRSDVTDTRPHYPDSLFTEQLISRPRLPIGKFLLNTNGNIVSSAVKLDIFKAQAGGTITTSTGKIFLVAFVPTGEQVINIRVSGTGGEKNVSWQWVPEKSITPRITFGRAKPEIYHYAYNPSPIIKDSAGFTICRQPLLNGGAYTTAWKQQDSTLSIAVGYGPEQQDGSTNEAIGHLEDFRKKKFGDVVNTHRQWWSDYFKKSFIAVPDARMQRYYWLELYNLASATRKGEPMVDLMGPWFTSNTPWPAIWWNLNTQLSYSNIFVTNHLETGRSLFDKLNSSVNTLINNVPPEWRNDAAAIGRISGYDLVAPLDQNDLRAGRFEPGNLTWTLFYYHRYFLYSQDTVELVRRIYPLLKRSVNYLVHLLKPGGDGKLHLVKSHSPEYADAEDAHYSLSALRWGLRTLIETDSMLDRHDNDRNNWNYILNRLADYHVNETGYMIGYDVALKSSHRHFSHLMMIYPYREVDPDDPESRSLMEKSVAHWLSMPTALAGYSYTGSASMYGYMRNGDSAFIQLERYLNRHAEVNGLYKESGPCFETPHSWVTAFAEMMLQSHRGVVSVFPSIPSHWSDLSFSSLRAEGAFLVDAVRAKGVTAMIRVRSEKGGPCVIDTDIPANDIIGPGNVSAYLGRTRVSIDMKAGDEIVIRNKRYAKAEPAPVEFKRYGETYFGLNQFNKYSNDQKFNW